MHLLLICKARRNQKPKIREAQEQAIRAAKEAKKARQASKKTAMAAAKAPTKAAPQQKIVETVWKTLSWLVRFLNKDLTTIRIK